MDKLTYNELFHIYKRDIIVPKILYKTKASNVRLISLMILGSIILAGSVFVFAETLSVLWLIASLGLSTILIYSISQKWVVLNNRKKLLSNFDYAFTEIEKEDNNLLLHRIQTELIKQNLGGDVTQQAYIKYLIISAKRNISPDNKFSSKNLGFAAIVLIIINNFVAFCFDYMKAEKLTPFDIFEKLVIVTVAIGIMTSLIYIIQIMFTLELNMENERHKELYNLLKNIKLELELQ